MPGQVYIYIPFSNSENNQQLVASVESWRREMRVYASQMFGADAVNAKRKTPVILVHGNGKPLLQLNSLQPDQYTLYVVAHCNLGKNCIWNINMFVKERVEIYADELVQRMHDDGLPRNIVNLKLYACRGGLRGDDDSKSFAERLANVMRESIYTDVVVTAYKEPLRAAAVTAQSNGHKLTESGARSSSVSVKF